MALIYDEPKADTVAVDGAVAVNGKIEIKLNLTNGHHLSRVDNEFLPAGREGNECGARCPAHPHYRCTRDRGHGTGTKSKPSDHDHAAHGWFKGAARSLIVMYARWQGGEEQP